MCLLLKRVSEKYGLNEPYTGGLSSHGLFLMLLAVHEQAAPFYLQQPMADPELYPGKLFIYFLSYYGNLNPDTTMVSYNMD